MDTTKSVNSTPIGGISPALSATPIPSSEPEEWTTFSNPKYKFSIAYPSRFEIVQYSETGDAFYLDQQIYISISRFDPLACRGGCPVAENTQPAIIAGLETTKITGYIGAMMAIPQRYITYTLQRGGQHYSITLYALRNDALATDPKNKCCNYVWPMKEDDVVLFEKILATFKFTD